MSLLSLTKRDVSIIGKNALRLEEGQYDYCGSCDDEDGNVEHHLCQCPAFARRRLAEMESATFDELYDVSVVELEHTLSYVRSSGWFCCRASVSVV